MMFYVSSAEQIWSHIKAHSVAAFQFPQSLQADILEQRTTYTSIVYGPVGNQIFCFPPVTVEGYPMILSKTDSSTCWIDLQFLPLQGHTSNYHFSMLHDNFFFPLKLMISFNIKTCCYLSHLEPHFYSHSWLHFALYQPPSFLSSLCGKSSQRRVQRDHFKCAFLHFFLFHF